MVQPISMSIFDEDLDEYIDTDYGIETLSQRYWSKVDTSGDCWLWQAYTSKGYGVFWLDGRNQLAHRVSYTLKHGGIPTGLQLDHLCRVRNCVRPSHLEPVPAQTNVKRAWDYKYGENKCKRGHNLTEGNLYYALPNRRSCRTCKLDKMSEYYFKRKTAIL